MLLKLHVVGGKYISNVLNITIFRASSYETPIAEAIDSN